MKPITTHQEIMFFARAILPQREFYPAGRCKSHVFNKQIMELEQACRAGMLFQMLPGLSLLFTGCQPFARRIYSTPHFVMISQVTRQREVEAAFSPDPYCFFDKVRCN